MNEEYRKYIMEKFFVEDFFEESPDGTYELEEADPGGETLLHFYVPGKHSMAVRNLDKKKTDFLFFRNEKALSLKKRTDHIVFEQKENGSWTVHLIEMKSSVTTKEKWLEIKGKFRASYLFVLAAAAILHMKIEHIRMYTTYEKETISEGCMTCMPENPVLKRVRTGEAPGMPAKEWNGGEFELRFGDNCRLPFFHIPVRVCRNEESRYLEGCYSCTS